MTATKRNVNRGYGRTSRFYDLPDGSTAPSVTAILGAIAKPALINWAAKVEREMILKIAGELWEDIPWPDAKKNFKKMTTMAYMATLTDRLGSEKASSRIVRKASDIGSQIHALAEWTLRQELGQKVGPRPQAEEQAEWGFMAWEDWRKSVNLVPRLIEQTVWSTKNRYAGTFDLDCEMDLPTPYTGRGEVTIDWKSGKAIYPESLLQISAYVEALIEMGHAGRPHHGLVVRVPKVIGDPAFETQFVGQHEITEHFKTFLAVRDLWLWLEKQDAL